MADAPSTRDAERTRSEILAVATREFADRGFAGARVDEIAASTRTTKRMLYYYFDDKRGLYMAALRAAYQRIRAAEQAIQVDDLEPIDAIRRIAELTFDHHEAHPEFIRMVSIENLHQAEHLQALGDVDDLGSPALELLERLLARGRETGAFGAGVDAIDVHMVISAFCVFRVSNRYTFGTIVGRDPLDPATRDAQRRRLGDMVVGCLHGG
jgi:AcrR family transcriptional regulator